FAGSAFLHGLAARPGWVEAWVGDGWGGKATAALGRLSEAAGTSTADLVLVVGVGWLLWSVLDGLAEVGAKRRHVANALATWALATFALVGGVGFVFDATWGMAYRRDPVGQRLGWGPPIEVVKGQPLDPAVAALVLEDADRLVAEASAAYRAVHGGDDGGAPTRLAAGRDADALVEAAYARVGARLALDPAFTAPQPRAAAPRLSPLMSWLGLGGFWFPFTGQAQVNGEPPDVSRLFTLAHEKAHGRMVGPEDEASLFAFLALIEADDPVLRYVGWNFAARQMVRGVKKVDPERAAAMLASLPAGMRRDQDEVVAFWEAHAGVLTDLAEAINDAYLKLHGVEGGKASYTRTARWISRWLRVPAAVGGGQGRVGSASP
ncbi:MAG: hypothetical protein RLZZ383_1649, partial [Pseudomonadota bacterium]